MDCFLTPPPLLTCYSLLLSLTSQPHLPSAHPPAQSAARGHLAPPPQPPVQSVPLEATAPPLLTLPAHRAPKESTTTRILPPQPTTTPSSPALAAPSARSATHPVLPPPPPAQPVPKAPTPTRFPQSYAPCARPGGSMMTSRHLLLSTTPLLLLNLSIQQGQRRPGDRRLQSCRL